jgi:Tol biopolymer transport system component
MRKAAIATAAAMGLLTAVMAMPAAAKPRAVNGQIVFGRDDPLLHDTVLYTINPDGSHERRLLDLGLSGPRWSPDGAQLSSCCSPLGNGHSAATIVDPDDPGDYVSLPEPDPADLDIYCGPWSPDGARLACESYGVSDDSLNGIYTIRASHGGGLRQLTSNPGGSDIPGDYAPDGSRLVYVHFPADFERAGLYVVNVNGTGARKIAPCCTSLGSWSPKGNEIVFSSRTSFDVHSTIWVVHSDGSGLRQIPLPAATCGGPTADPNAHGCADPVWSPDGKKIVFRITTPGFGEGGDLYTLNADGTGLTEVTHDGDVEFPDWGTHPIAVG